MNQNSITPRAVKLRPGKEKNRGLGFAVLILCPFACLKGEERGEDSECFKKKFEQMVTLTKLSDFRCAAFLRRLEVDEERLAERLG
ncbi:hypothetical protein ElyMa_004393400 [Elysia marginata]|uniref:Uncharacterized protein n=1 Tax=Elysia marginata TaxID=1093978 RepID=A0AAV4H827_9GAST|nr:hypothetical protein ElyMa_004393400 [Elysia marginata]